MNIIDDYDVRCIRISLDDRPYYKTNIMIGNIPCLATFSYNTISNKRSVSIETTDGLLLLKDTFLAPYRRVEINTNINILGFDCYLALIPYSSSDVPNNYLKWSDKYNLTFILNDREFSIVLENLYVDWSVS